MYELLWDFFLKYKSLLLEFIFTFFGITFTFVRDWNQRRLRGREREREGERRMKAEAARGERRTTIKAEANGERRTTAKAMLLLLVLCFCKKREVARMRSSWTRSFECRRLEAVGAPSSSKLGVKMQGRVLFKQPQNVVMKSVSPKRANHHINFRSNMEEVIKVVFELVLHEGHFRQLRRMPFWLMFEAIVINKPDYNVYRKCDDLVVKILKAFNRKDDAFYIGVRLVKLRKVDIRLVFGLQCSDQHVDLTPGTRPASDFIQRRCSGVGRITASLIRNLLDDAIKGKTVRDEENTAKLLCLYFCVKLFFSTSGETISWVFVRYIDNLDTLQTYDWTAAI